MSRLSLSSRGVLAAALTVTAASVSLTAMSTYIYDPMASSFNLDGQVATEVKAIPTVATVLVVFLAGTLGARVGQRRVLAWASTGFWFGALITAAAPGVVVAVIGLCVMGAGASTMSVVAVAMLSTSFTTKEDRANAFSAFGVVPPAVYVVAPIFAGAIVTTTSWRWVALSWVALGIAAWLLSARFLPKDQQVSGAGEIYTPLIAGVALALFVMIPIASNAYGLMSLPVLVLVLSSAAVFALLLVVHRRISNPTLSFAPLRKWRSWALLFVVVTVPITTIWYTAYLAFQYLYGLDALQISVIMIPAQFAGMIGARVMKPVIPKLGLKSAGIAVLSLLVLIQLSYLLMNGSTMWFSFVMITLYGFASTGLTVVLANSVMNSAAKQDAGAMSSYRSATSRIGSTLGTLIIGGVLFTTYDISMANQEGPTGGTTTSLTAGSITPTEVTAMVESLHARGLMAAIVTMLSIVAFVLAMRKRAAVEE